MGIVLKQTLKNVLVTYVGFGLGAANTLLLYTHVMQTSAYGLVQIILSIAAVLTPFLALGVPNTLVKYFSSFKNQIQQEGFLTLMLLLPCIIILPLSAASYLFYEEIGVFLTKKNPVVKEYITHILFAGIAMGYFEIFYAWAKIRMQSVFGNFLKEIFCRVAQTSLLLALWLEYISIAQFINALVACYILRTVLMGCYALLLKNVQLRWVFPKNKSTILKYSLLIILGGSTAMVLLEVDKVMLNNFLTLDYIAYYAVAGFIASVIAVPSRAMHQITYPLTASQINKGDSGALKILYHKSSLTLLIISGLLLLLIFLNLKDLYSMLPLGYSKGLTIVFWLGLVKLYDAALGNNNAILYNSDYYRTILFFGVLLAGLAVGFNLWLIPTFGINGAAIASFSAFFIYNTLKVFYVKLKFDMLPFTKETRHVVLLMMLTAGVFYFIQFPFHPLLNIALKSIFIVLFYTFLLYRFKISEDIFNVLSKYLKK